MNQYKKVLLLFLSLSPLSMHAAKEVIDHSYLLPNFSAIAYTPKNCAKLAALSFFVWTVIKFQMTEPSNRPARYSFDEIMSGTDLLKNMKYLILDGLIGHKSKRPSMRVYPDGKVSAELCEAYDDLKSSHQTGTVVLRPGAYSKGIYGWIHDYTSPTLTALALLTTITTKRHEFETGLATFVDYFGLDEEDNDVFE